MNAPIRIEILNRRDFFAQGESDLLSFALSRSSSAGTGVVILPAGFRHPSAVLNLDLFTQDLPLNAGESAIVSVGVRFDSCGPFDYSQFTIQVNPVAGSDGQNIVLPFPSHPFRVVPSLERVLALSVHRICGYDDAVKVEVVLLNRSGSEVKAIELTLDPPEAVRAGPLRRAIPSLLPGREIRFDLVVTANRIGLRVAAIVEGEWVEMIRDLAVPATSDTATETRPAFVFLEPRALTSDRVTITRVGTAGASVVPNNGVFRLFGGKSRYVLTVFPSHPAASNVRLYPARGQVEVEPLESKAGQWDFLLTVVDNPTLTLLVRLDYDVQVTGIPQRGELYLSIQPTSWKHWSIAITAGFAVTVKGAAGVIPTLVREEAEWGGIWEALGESWFDVVQLVSIGLIYGGLMAANYLWTSSIES